MVTRDSRVVRNGKEEQRSYIGTSSIHISFGEAHDRLITLNALKASDEITEEQSRQVRNSFDGSVRLIGRCCLISRMLIMSSFVRWEARTSEPIRWVVHWTSQACMTLRHMGIRAGYQLQELVDVSKP